MPEDSTDNEFSGFRRNVLFGTADDMPRVVEIDLDNLQPNPDQPRTVFDEGALDELASSIEEHGLINAVTVAKTTDDDDYIIVAGERRFRAFQRLNRETIPAIVTSGNADEIALVENVQREDLSPIEEAEAVQKLIDRHDYTHEDVASVIGKSRSTVTNLLGLLNGIPEDIRKDLKEQRSTSNISKSALIELSKLDGDEKKHQVWEEMHGGNVTVRAIRQAKKRQPKQQKKQRTKSPAEQTQDMLKAGRRFANRIEEVRSHGVEGSEAYEELISLREKIDQLIDDLPLPPQDTAPTDDSER